MQETWVQFLGWEDPLEKGIATHSSILAWRMPQTEEPGELQSMGSQRVRHDWGSHTHTHILNLYIVKREQLPTPVFWSGEFHGLCTAHGVAKSWTWLTFTYIKHILIKSKEKISFLIMGFYQFFTPPLIPIVSLFIRLSQRILKSKALWSEGVHIRVK